MATHNDFGKQAENLAAEFLVQNEYRILAKNYIFQKAEIDIIAEKDHQIIIVEVKARSTDFFILPQEAVNKRKIKLIVTATNHFLEINNIEKEVRFDIISILKNEVGNLEIQHLQDAFQSIDSI